LTLVFVGEQKNAAVMGYPLTLLLKQQGVGAQITSLEEKAKYREGENGDAAKSACEPLCAELIGWMAPVSAVSGLCEPFEKEVKKQGCPYQNLRRKTKNKSLSASAPEVIHHVKESTDFCEADLHQRLKREAQKL